MKEKHNHHKWQQTDQLPTATQFDTLTIKQFINHLFITTNRLNQVTYIFETF